MHDVRGEVEMFCCVLSSERGEMFICGEQGVGMRGVCSYQGGIQVAG